VVPNDLPFFLSSEYNLSFVTLTLLIQRDGKNFYSIILLEAPLSLLAETIPTAF
jgi:hypothetical protein